MGAAASASSGIAQAIRASSDAQLKSTIAGLTAESRSKLEAGLDDTSESATDRRAFLFAQMLPKQFNVLPGAVWAEFNKQLAAEKYELVIYLADPKLFRLLTLGEAADGTEQDVLKQNYKKALTMGSGDRVPTDFALSNISFFTTYDLLNFVEELCSTCDKEEDRIRIMASISNSSYDVPKVLDFLLRVCFPDVPTARFDSDVIIDFAGKRIDLSIFNVVKRAEVLFKELQSREGERPFAFSSRYNEVDEAKGRDWCKHYSTRPNPAMSARALLDEYGSVTGKTPEAAALAGSENLKALSDQAKSLESLYYSTKGGDKSSLNIELWDKACVDANMELLYNSLSSQGCLKREFSTSNCFSNAVISGAGMVLSANYCKLNPPFLVFGKYQDVSSANDEDIDDEIANMANQRSQNWDGPQEGELFPNVMWIDDEITAEYVRLNPSCRGDVPYPTVAYPEADGKAVFASKKRSAPGNPLWYTLAIYMPTLYTGFVVMVYIKGLRDGNTCLQDFQKLMPEDSIGKLWCTVFAKAGGADKTSKMLAQVDSVMKQHDLLRQAWQRLMCNGSFVTDTAAKFKKRFALDKTSLDACKGDLTALRL